VEMNQTNNNAGDVNNVTIRPAPTRPHTAGRWGFHPGDPKYPGQGGTIIVQKSRIVARMDRGSNPKEQAEMEANGRRIVACVNACQGIDTETLEHLVELATTDAARLASLSLQAENVMRQEFQK
jgi:hypothetical protein